MVEDRCPTCNGKGRTDPGGPDDSLIICDACGGKGWVGERPKREVGR